MILTMCGSYLKTCQYLLSFYQNVRAPRRSAGGFQVRWWGPIVTERELLVVEAYIIMMELSLLVTVEFWRGGLLIQGSGVQGKLEIVLLPYLTIRYLNNTSGPSSYTGGFPWTHFMPFEKCYQVGFTLWIWSEWLLYLASKLFSVNLWSQQRVNIILHLSLPTQQSVEKMRNKSSPTLMWKSSLYGKRSW